MNIYRFLKVSTLFLLVLLISSCTADKISEGRLTDIESALNEIRDKWVPDQRVAVFNIERVEDRKGVLLVESDLADAAKAVEALVRDLPAWRNHIDLVTLPHSDLGNKTHGLVSVSVANLRRDSRHQSELVDQAIMGTPLKILKQRRGWFYIKTPWNYLGWVTGDSFEQLTSDELSERWPDSELAYVLEVDTRIYERPTPQSEIVSDATQGATVKPLSRSGSFTKVQLPDLREGFILTNQLGSIPSINNDITPSASGIVSSARQFLGLPYLWGGNSGKGFDCSGFTLTAFRDNGYLLPRDANMQVKLGNTVDYDETFSTVKPGDLLFFGSNLDRITHVGISLGRDEFIHASTYVMLNSLTEGAPNFSGYHSRTLQVIKRIE